ncbi:Tyrosine-protein kinase Fps85D [Trichuris trichiura]|uniref:Tyrosine-protein kinase Fps85D n=1 Tax=Trichuris trichiura TaxID=36087 RepID=A0A077Z5R5_TRITR|nr:Tyrosine-protein kinase Fps85D [Trichuris trichiura]
MSEDDCKDFLQLEGDFLLRCCKDNTSPHELTWFIAVRNYKNMVQQVPVKPDDQGRYVLMERSFSSIRTLVQHFNTSREVIGSNGPVVLRRVAAKPKWMLSNDAITKFARIGHGQGGSVWAGTLNNNCHLGKQQVAIKLLVEDAKPEQVASFEREARIHRQLSHQNIVQFIAIVIDKSPIRLVTELCDYNLKIHLKKNASKLTINDKIQICLEVSEGLAYLVDKGFIHRDIAARNCLMKRGRVRITDLGLAVRVVGAKTAFSEAEKLPIKTTAPEGLICKAFSEKSDMWAFGILMWEVLSNGSEPYESLIRKLDKFNWGNQLVANILAGYRMPVPVGTPKHVETLIKNCWQRNPDKRPTFQMARKTLSNKGASKKWYQRFAKFK